jgi:hypothetical protein
MRLALAFLVSFIATLALTGCLGSAPDATDGGGTMHQLTNDGGSDGGSSATDSGVPTPIDSGTGGTIDFSNADLTGLTNCYGVTACDPNEAFCIRFYAGSQTTPGSLAGGPACYEPSDTCANQGQNMDCGCIQADPILGVACQGSCVDHMDGTYDCYAM